MTRQGEAVERAIREAGGFRTAQDLYAEMRDAGMAVGLATVYRHLQRLEREGLLDALNTDDGRVAYRYCHSGDHHHHIVCRSCGRTVEVHDGSLEQWTERVAHDAGFSDVTHRVEIFGTCGTCAPVRPPAPGRPPGGA